MKPKNDWAKCLYILKHSNQNLTSMANVLIDWDATFYKFQARLSEIEKEHSSLVIERKNIPYLSKLTGKSKHYTQYMCTSSMGILDDLYERINEFGLSGKN